MAAFFIDRPVLASVIVIAITLGGLVCMWGLPIAQFPEIAPPTIEIEAAYPGASAETVALSLAAPIEQELSGTKNLLYYQSQCANDGKLKTTVTFEIGSDLDLAAVEVQNRVKRAESRLPQEAVRQGITITKKSSNVLLAAAIGSSDPQYNELFLNNYATINISDALKRVSGVGDVIVYGAKDYAMRVWINPDRLAQKGLTVADVSTAIREQNGLFAAGRLGQRPNPTSTDLTFPVITRGRLEEPSQFEDIILRSNADGSAVRIEDIGRAELGAQSYDLFGRLSGRPTTLILVYLQPGANALATARAVRTTLKDLSVSFPKGVEHDIPFDTTRFVEVSINKVIQTFVEAVILVILVVYLFLQSWRTTLVPLLAVPVAIIGTFAGMMALGFSINTLTLFGLVLAIGTVVDDAIVVVENVERIMRGEHLPAREASIKAMREVTGPVVASTLVLVAVFVPVGFLGGLTGQLYKQFAVTVAVSVVISSIVALTFTPALCRLLLKAEEGRKLFLFRWFNAGFDALTRGYTHAVRWGVRLSIVTLLLFSVLCWGSLRLFDAVPGGLVPQEDQGFFLATVLLPDGASLDRTDAVVRRVEDYLVRREGVAHVMTLGGQNLLAGGATFTNAASLWVILKPWEDRRASHLHLDAIMADVNRQFASVPEAFVIAFNPPPIPGLGARAGFEFQLQDRSGSDVRRLAGVSQDFIHQCRARPELAGVSGTLGVSLPQLYIDLDRNQVKAMGVPIDDVFSTLQAFLGSLYVNDFDKFGRVYRVQIQAEPAFREKPADLMRVSVRGANGSMVPLGSLLGSKFQAGPNLVSRFNGFMSVQITGGPAPGYSTGQAMAALREVAAEALPAGFGFEWSGAAYQEISVGNQAVVIIAVGLIMIVLVLAAQYEQWSLPLAVLLAVPTGIFGALLAVFLRGVERDVYFQIGLLTLTGLAAKNAILIVEFCVVLRRSGRSIFDSAVEAAGLRFRPIMMTSLTFILGVVPLAVAGGAGAASQHSIGTGVLGGMITATALGLLFVPTFFAAIAWLVERVRPGHEPRSAAISASGPEVASRVGTEVDKSLDVQRS